MQYENTLSLEQLRIEVRRLWDERHAFADAIRDLPEVAPVKALSLLADAAMATTTGPLKGRGLSAIGNQLQREHGLDAVPPNSEYEHAAGLWFLIRQGLKSGTRKDESASKHTMTITLDDESKTVEVVDFGGKVIKLTSASLTVERKSVEDVEAEEKSGHLYRIFKLGRVMELRLRGEVA